MSKIRKIYVLTMSSSDVRQSINNDMMMMNKLKSINKNIITNNSYSGEEVEEGSYLLKGGTLTSLWSSVFNYVDTCCMHKKEHGWSTAVTLKVNRK